MRGATFCDGDYNGVGFGVFAACMPSTCLHVARPARCDIACVQPPGLTSCSSVQADAMEHALMAALPLGPQSAAGGISLPDSFHGELQVLQTSQQPAYGLGS